MIPAVDGRGVHPGHQQGPAVGRPPVAPHPAHLLGRDELGEAVADPRLPVRPDDLPVLAGRQVGDPYRAVAHVGDPLARRIGVRVERGRPGRDRPRRGLPRQVRQVDVAGQREHRHRQRGVGGELHDARLPARGSVPGWPSPRQSWPRQRRRSWRGRRPAAPGPVPVSSTHRQVTGSLPPWLRRKATRLPSGEIWNERGAPRLNPWVLACCRGKLSVMPRSCQPGGR